jgi:hypothetical protein
MKDDPQGAIDHAKSYVNVHHALSVRHVGLKAGGAADIVSDAPIIEQPLYFAFHIKQRSSLIVRKAVKILKELDQRKRRPCPPPGFKLAQQDYSLANTPAVTA